MADVGCHVLLTFNSQKWSKQNSSQQYLYIIQQTGNKNIQIYQVEAAILI